MVQEVRKFMEKSGERDPELVMKVLNNNKKERWSRDSNENHDGTQCQGSTPQLSE